MKHPVSSSLVCLSIIVALSATSCSDDENPTQRPTGDVAGRNAGSAGRGSASGGKVVGGAPQQGDAGRAVAGNAANDGNAGSNAAGSEPIGMAGSSGNSATASAGSSSAAGATATGAAGRSSNAGGDGQLSLGGAATNAGSNSKGNGGAIAVAGHAGVGIVNSAGTTGSVAVTGGTGATGQAGNAGTSSCRLAPQSGCSGQACDLDYTRLSQGITTCRPIAAAGTEVSACTTSSECAAGYLCLGGSCARFCENDAHCAAPGGLCVKKLLNSSTAQPIPGVTACSKNCDPFTAAGCPSGRGCSVYLDVPTQRSYTDCIALSVATGTQGATCSSDADCAVGYGCVNVTTNGTTVQSCLAYCVVGAAAPPCPSNTACYAFNPAVTVGTTQYGICMN